MYVCKHLFLCIISVSFQFEFKSEPPKKVHVKHFCKGIFLCLVFVCIQFQNNWATDKKVKMLRWDSNPKPKKNCMWNMFYNQTKEKEVQETPDHQQADYLLCSLSAVGLIGPIIQTIWRTQASVNDCRLLSKSHIQENVRTSTVWNENYDL